MHYKTCVFIALALLYFLQSTAQESLGQLIINKEYTKALEEVNRMIENNPEAALFHQKGIILREKYDYLGSMSAFNQAVILDQRNIHYLSDLAEIMNAIGNVADATDIYKKASSLDPGNSIIKIRLGQLYIAQRNFQESYKLFSELRLGDSLNLIINKNLAVSASRIGKVSEAIELFEFVLNNNPRDIGSYLSLAALFQQKRLFTRSNSVLESGLSEFPNHSVIQLRLAQNLYRQRDFESALPVYRAWAAKNQLYFDVRRELGIVLYFNKMEEDALSHLKYAMHEAPEDPFVALYIGLCYKRLKDYETSKQYLNQAIESSFPGYLSEIYHHLGQVHGQLREFTASLEMLKKAWELDNGKHELLFEIATTYDESSSNKTLALNYYQIYLTEAREKALNADYALNRMRRLKEELFFE